MLYLSKIVCGNQYVIVDTDDNSETLVSIKQLAHYVSDLYLTIYGCRIDVKRLNGVAVKPLTREQAEKLAAGISLEPKPKKTIPQMYGVVMKG